MPNTINPEKIVIVIYVFCSAPNGPGGWASLIRYRGKTDTLSGNEFPTTDLHLHLTATFKALEHLSLSEDLPLFPQIDIYTPSESLSQNLQEPNPSKYSNKSITAKEERQLWKELIIADVEYNLIWHQIRELKNNNDVKLVYELATLKFEEAEKRLERVIRKKEDQMYEGSLIYELHQKEGPASTYGKTIPIGGTATGRKKRG